MAHSYHAYIDESGDDGFTFKPWPDRGSSEWFVVSACIVRDCKLSEASDKLNDLVLPVEHSRKSPIHFAKLTHEVRVGIVHGLARLPMRVISICFNKMALPPGHTLEGNRRLYFYAVRYLLERISWFARENAQGTPGDGRCKLNFSHCRGLSYPELFAYLGRLQNDTTQIAWQHIDTSSCIIEAHDASVWLRATDCVASGFARALELTPQGFCEDRYARLLRPVVYAYQRRRWSYGLKITPFAPPVEKERDNRYEWLSLYRN